MKNSIFVFLFLCISLSLKAQYMGIAMNNNGGFWLLGTDNKVTSVNPDLTGWTPYPYNGSGLVIHSNRGTPLLVGMNTHFFYSSKRTNCGQ